MTGCPASRLYMCRNADRCMNASRGRGRYKDSWVGVSDCDIKLPVGAKTA